MESPVVDKFHEITLEREIVITKCHNVMLGHAFHNTKINFARPYFGVIVLVSSSVVYLIDIKIPKIL